MSYRYRRFLTNSEWRLIFAALLVQWLVVVPAHSETSDNSNKAKPISNLNPSKVISDLEQAYKKEFAFLQAEKANLQKRIVDFEKQAKLQSTGLEAEITALEKIKVSLDLEVEKAETDLKRADDDLAFMQESKDLLVSQFLQMQQSLKALGLTFAEAGEKESPYAERLEKGVSLALVGLAKGAEIYTESGSFYTSSGKKELGTILHVGQIAAYVTKNEHHQSGALVPSGQGEYRLWDHPTEAIAALPLQASEPLIDIFLYESLDKAYTPPKEKTMSETLQAGGPIGWAIVGLGVLAIVLLVIRTVMLRKVSRNMKPTSTEVEAHIKNGKFDEAMHECLKRGGPSARVLQVALMSRKHDREKTEDMVAESLLKETVWLDRFSTVITVTAAVAPLLGLLGTVTGMIATFDMITTIGTGDPKMLSGGISEALVTTMLGLIVAIPTLFCGSLLNNQAENIKSGLEGAALRVINLAAQMLSVLKAIRI